MEAEVIRPAGPDDMPAMQAIERAAGVLFRDVGMASVADDPPLEAPVLATYIADGRAWLAEIGGVPAGYALAGVVDNHGHLEQVSVDPRFARRGLGRRLVARVVAWARTRGYTTLTLLTFRTVPWNGPYYAKLGFRPLSDTDLAPELRRLRALEAEHGLDIDARHAMALDLGGPETAALLAPPARPARSDPAGNLTIREQTMDSFQAIDDFIGEQMALGHTPGLALAVANRDAVLLQRGYGHADVARGVPMTERTRVVIGSTTKALTALAVMQLVEQGKASLDDEVRTYLPGFRMAQEAARRITLRQILSHSAGLPPTPIDGPAFLFSDDRVDAAQRYVDELAAVDLVWEPGGGWLYANDGYVMAGRVIEEISGLSFEQYMAERVLGPMGLEQASFAEATPPADSALPYDYDRSTSAFPSWFPHSRAANAAGMLMFTAQEAGRWLRYVLNTGELDGKRVIGAAALAETTRPQVPLSAAARVAGRQVAESYGLGWMTGDLAGRRLIAHGGSAITMGSMFMVLPDEGLGVAVLANSGTEVSGVVAEGVLRLLTGGTPQRSFPRIPDAVQPDHAFWRRLEGIYTATAPQNGVTSLLPIEIDGDVLCARTFPGNDRRRPGNFYLTPSGPNEFVIFGRGKTGGLATFQPDSIPVRGTIQGAPVRQVAQHVHSGHVLNWRES